MAFRTFNAPAAEPERQQPLCRPLVAELNPAGALLDQFHLVAVRVFEEGDHAASCCIGQPRG